MSPFIKGSITAVVVTVAAAPLTYNFFKAIGKKVAETEDSETKQEKK